VHSLCPCFFWITIRECFTIAQGANILGIFTPIGSGQTYPAFLLFAAVIGQNILLRPAKTMDNFPPYHFNIEPN
jgi:hypothetical protein